MNNDLKAKIEAVKRANEKKLKAIHQTPFKQILDRPEPTASTIYTSGRSNMNNKNILNYLLKNKNDLQKRVQNASMQAAKEENLLKNAQSRAGGNLAPQESAQTLGYNLAQGLDSSLMPGNVGDINRIIWPFWFTTSQVTLEPNQAGQGNITITQEASFIWTGYSKVVLLEETGGPGQYQYIDPFQPDDSAKANDLNFLIRDSQSSRQFMNKPMSINMISDGRILTNLPTPQLILPNSNIEVTYQNNSASATYRPFITFFGYRLRIDHSKDILSTISA